MSARVAPDGLNRGTPPRSVLGFSEQAHGWVKKLIGTSEKGFCKGLCFAATSGGRHAQADRSYETSSSESLTNNKMEVIHVTLTRCGKHVLSW